MVRSGDNVANYRNERGYRQYYRSNSCSFGYFLHRISNRYSSILTNHEMCPCLLHYQYNLLPTEFHKPLHNLGLLINIQRQPNAFPFLSTGE